MKYYIKSQKLYRLLLPLTLVTLLLLSSGCTNKTITQYNTQPKSDAEYAYRNALREYEEQDYEQAQNDFKRLKLAFPYAKKWTSLAELRIADIYLENNQEELAAATYRFFIQSYPTHPEVPYALFKIGVAFEQLMPSDFFVLPNPWQRELKTAKQAEIAFKNYLRRFPKGKFAATAKQKLAAVQDRLANHEIYVAEYYFKQKAYRGAASRAKYIIKFYPHSSLAPQAYILLANAFIHLHDPHAATKYLKRLIEKHPKTENAQQAREWINKHPI